MQTGCVEKTLSCAGLEVNQTQDIEPVKPTGDQCQLEDVLALMNCSAQHRSFDVATVMRCIVPPLRLGQHIWVEDNGAIVAWASWAFMDPDTAKAFLNGAYKVHPDDWCCGEEIIIMDVLAPFGYVGVISRKLRNLFQGETVSWLRQSKGNRKTRLKNG